MNRLISDFDFWNVDRDKWQELGSTGPTGTHSSGSAVRIVLQFCTMKGAKKRHRETYVNDFLK